MSQMSHCMPSTMYEFFYLKIQTKTRLACTFHAMQLPTPPSMSMNGSSVIYDFTYYIRIIYVKLATKWKLHRVSTYLPNLEGLCSEHIWTSAWPP
jgi:hypothetical protein